MSPVLAIASLTIREAVRRRLLLAFMVITVVVVGMSAWGFDRLSHAGNLTSGESNLAVPQALILFMFMFSFIVALSASAIAAPSISSEIESGVLLTVVTRPVRRSEILAGKWLGLAALLGGYAVIVCALEFAVVDAVSGFLAPDPVLAAVYLYAEGLLLLTLSLLLSTRVSMIATGVIGVAAFGASWLAGVVGALGAALSLPALRTVGTIGRFLVPTDGLWHGAIYYLEPQSLIAQQLGNDGARDPFFAQGAPSVGYLLWVACWFALVLLAAGASFERREL